MDAVVNPYALVNWSGVQHVCSISHAHARVKRNDGQIGEVKQKYLDNAVDGGAKHIMFSNYYPSEPFYPLSDFFETVPPNIIASPNAEHHSVIGYPNFHFNGLGCTFSSGQAGGLEPTGINMTVDAAFMAVLGSLQYQDGGGITINHIGWTVAQNTSGWVESNSFDIVMKLLNIDSRVLGIEIQNSYESVVMGYGEDLEANIRLLWDKILMTGKRCWGFCVPDHETEYGNRWTGRNILLVDSLDEHKCLKAYRDGNFYSQIFDSDLSFESITYSDNHFAVSAPNADSIKIIIDGEVTSISGNSADIEIPNGSTFVRAEAWLDYNWIDRNGVSHNVTDKIYSNPIMFKEYVAKKSNNIAEQFVILMN